MKILPDEVRQIVAGDALMQIVPIEGLVIDFVAFWEWRAPVVRQRVVLRGNIQGKRQEFKARLIEGVLRF